MLLQQDNIHITKHAIERYKERIKETEDIEEIRNFYIDTLKNGKWKKKRKSVLEKNADEYIVETKQVSILILKWRNADKMVVLTCYGDEILRKWYKKQNRLEMRKLCYQL